MKKVCIFLLLLACFLSGSAQTDGTYYRVQNKVQERYISVMDNRGQVYLSQTDADMGALRTVLGFDLVVSDPSTIIYFKKISSGWALQSQGTSTTDIIGTQYALKIDGNDSKGYRCYATYSGVTKYLSDDPYDEWDVLLNGYDPTYGKIVTNTEKNRLWNLLPLTATGSSYFGLKPDVALKGNYYQTFYASFPFTCYDADMSIFYVKKVDVEKAAIVIEELTGGVPAATPVIVKCSANVPSQNRLNVGAKVTGSASGNLLNGVYFCNDVESKDHRNVVDYDAKTMRVLGTAADGSLAFVTSSTLKYIPANTAYIKVSADAPAELKVYTQAEYDQLTPAVVGDLNGDGAVTVADQVIMGNIILNLRPYSDAADLNNDGIVNVTDYVALGNIVLGKKN